MKCPHCTIEIHDDPKVGDIPEYNEGDPYPEWAYKFLSCPACNNSIIRFCKYSIEGGEIGYEFEQLVYPRSARRSPIDNVVPEYMREDYDEACSVLLISPKASAALSRRILQALLQEQGYSGRNLVDQIDAVIKETDSSRSLPTLLLKTIDAVRNFGNFSAHPITEKNSLQIIDVEPQEAEWCLEIVEQLFEHYYVRPAANEKRVSELNKKLSDAGKPPMKS